MDTNGNNGNNGTSPSSPWQNLHYAFTNASFKSAFAANNVVVEATGGEVFPETNLIITNLNPAPHSVVFSSRGSTPAIISNWIDGSTSPVGAGFSCAIANSSYMTISNLSFYGSSSLYSNHSFHEYGLLLIGSNAPIHHITVLNCNFQWHEYGGLEIAPCFGSEVSYASNIIINNCVANSNTVYGFQLDNWNGLGTAPVDFNINLTNDVSYNSPGFSSTPNTASYGFSLTSCSNVYAVRCLATNNGFGYIVAYAAGVNLIGCVAHDGGSFMPASMAGGVAAMAYMSSDVNITSGEFYNWHRNAAGDGDGIDFDVNSYNCSASYNYVHNCDGAGLYMYGTYGSNCYSWNIATSNGLGNLSYGAEGGIYPALNNPTNVLFYNNNLIATVPGVPAFRIINGGGFIAGGAVSANNIFVVANASPSVIFGEAGFDNSNNDYYRSDGTAFSVSWTGTTYSTVAAWQTATGQDANALLSNPHWLNGFADPTFYPASPQRSTNWILSAASSALVNAAANLNNKFGINNGGYDFVSNSVPVSGYNVGAVNESQ